MTVFVPAKLQQKRVTVSITSKSSFKYKCIFNDEHKLSLNGLTALITINLSCQ